MSQHVSGDMEAALAAAGRIRDALTAADFPARGLVCVRTDGAYEVTVPAAVAVRWKDWVLVVGERHPPQAFHIDDLVSVAEFQLVRNLSTLRTPDRLTAGRRPPKKGP